ncbi:UPF0755 protein [Methylomagnum ishizawai]|uniref:Endolytic murein transglycosylase n=1 Tax=Methylomagnum ishizawai TaxID=1760988 RepID=A0A1Y6CW59_9GAMM|nr:endolytic transglycosylase MltG [Methylomagnum ishizawai]SMF94899.1 UPF0755 protein [Methylomagnum ishizawai]
MVDDENPGGTGPQRPHFPLGYRLLGGLVLLSSLLAGWLWMDYRRFVDSPLGLKSPVVFEIGQGEGLQAIAQGLKRRGILRKPLWFEWLAYSGGAHQRLKYGEYEIPVDATPRTLLDRIVAGKVLQHPVTVVEGWKFSEMLAALALNPVLNHRLAGQPPEAVMAALGFPGQAPEGRFFPDTYFVTKGTSDLEILRRAHAKMDDILDREWQGRPAGLPFASSYEALILASIVEKETARPEERTAVAGVFLRRLQKKMRLQTDPTVIYGMGAAYDGDIRKGDLLRDTPYNTYTRSGLPPTPIALPGLPAIHAALHPDVGDSLYFVARGDGSHVFSATLEAHRRAVERFQKR